MCSNDLYTDELIPSRRIALLDANIVFYVGNFHNYDF